MKQFKELDITGPDERLFALVDGVSANLPPHWHRDPESEARMNSHALSGEESIFSFARDAKDDDPPARLFLHHQPGRLFVSNIVPRDPGHLGMRRYNEIVDEFAELLRAPLSADRELAIEVLDDDAAITDWLSTEAADLLSSFSNLANKSTRASHPLDYERWTRFLIQAHKERAVLDSTFLSRWLVEELGWSEDGANELARDYALARDLLRAYDESS